MDTTDKAITEYLSLGTSNTEMVFDVASSLFEVERGEMEADSDALVERLERRETELVSEIRLTKENERDERRGIHIVVEQKSQLFKDVGREEVSFVNDKQNATTFAGQIRESGVKLREQLRKVKQGFGLEGE